MGTRLELAVKLHRIWNCRQREMPRPLSMDLVAWLCAFNASSARSNPRWRGLFRTVFKTFREGHGDRAADERRLLLPSPVGFFRRPLSGSGKASSAGIGLEKSGFRKMTFRPIPS